LQSDVNAILKKDSFIMHQGNQLLAALPAGEFERLFSQLELVPLKMGQVLYESGDIMRYVYFPISAIVSLMYMTASGSSAEIAMVGNEGVIGVALFMGGNSTHGRAVVQHTGYAYRLKGQTLKTEFQNSVRLQRILLIYTQALLTQMAQIAICNRHHTIEQQLCRWLLWSLDRLPTNQVEITQELIARMLGVRREGITEAAGKLQAAGLIQYSRGLITVVNRPGLEKHSCECYSEVKKESDRLMSSLSSLSSLKLMQA
jgi:CRP-like cAMP-binding protein